MARHPNHGPTNGSWWKDAPRDGFTAQCWGESERMQKAWFPATGAGYQRETTDTRTQKKAVDFEDVDQ